MEEIKIQVPNWKLYLAFLGIVLFVILGILMLKGDTTFFEKLAAILTIVFFGGFGGLATCLILVKGKGNILISPIALKLNFPNCPTIIIKWDDIESFGTFKISGQGFTTIKLKNYDNLISSIDPADAKKMIKVFKSIVAIGHTTVVIGEMNLEDTTELINILPEDRDLINLSTLLNYSRSNFEGEFLIGWNMRDRKASELSTFLMEKKIQYS